MQQPYLNGKLIQGVELYILVINRDETGTFTDTIWSSSRPVSSQLTRIEIRQIEKQTTI